MKPRLIHGSALPQLIIVTILLMLLARLIILVDGRQYRRLPLRHAIAFWLGFFIVFCQYILTKLSQSKGGDSL